MAVWSLSHPSFSLLVHFARSAVALGVVGCLGTPTQVNRQRLALDAGAALLGVDADQAVRLGIELLFQGDDDALYN